MRLTEIAHQHLSEHLRPGDLAIDATAGNGHDTAHLASLVGPEGHVIAIDIQETAIAATRERLRKLQYLERVKIVEGDHSQVLNSLLPAYSQQIAAIIFNLGYLPGGNKSARTHPTTTVHALTSGQKLLNPDGLLLVTAYRGHEGGQSEADTVAKWAHQIESNDWSVDRYDPVSIGKNIPPLLFVARKPT